MDVLIVIALLFLPLLCIYELYEPKVDIVPQPKGYIVLLWYNEYVDGYYTGRRTYKKLF